MDAEELVALIRDLTLILFAGFATLVLFLATLLGMLLYRKIAPILDSARNTAKQAEELSSQLGEKVVKPLVSGSAFAYAAGRVVAFMLGLSRGKGGRKNGG
ncbi:MAG: hypothetical protein HYX93_03455 [Chloroflexi bacterium]|nr:hypothetical protein [Chloroflexota bacterium]